MKATDNSKFPKPIDGQYVTIEDAHTDKVIRGTARRNPVLGTVHVEDWVVWTDGRGWNPWCRVRAVEWLSAEAR